MNNRRDQWFSLPLIFTVMMTWGACSSGGSPVSQGGSGGTAGQGGNNDGGGGAAEAGDGHSGGTDGSGLGGQSGDAGMGDASDPCGEAGAAGTGVNLLLNGGFEQPPLGSAGALRFIGVGDSTTLPGWSVFGHAGGDCAVVQTPFDFGGFSYKASEGVQIMDLTGRNDVNGVSDVGVQQTVATVAGKTYVLSFLVANQFDPAGGLNGQTSKVAVLTNGTVILHAVNSDMPANKINSWKRFCVSFVADGPTTTIGLQCEDPVSDTSDGIDDVSLVQQ